MSTTDDPEEQSQDQQAKNLRNTGNGPTVDDEETLLHAEFGNPNADGVYGAPADEDGGADA